MTTEAEQIEVPKLETTSDGKRIFTPEQWLEKVSAIHNEQIQNRHY